MNTFNLTITKSRGICKILLQANDSVLQTMTATEFTKLFCESYHKASEMMDKVPFIQEVTYSSNID